MSSVLHHLTNLATPWAYVVVGLLAALEASAFVGLFVPGELALLTGGYVAFQGKAGLGLMMLAAACGAIAGDSVGYEIGRLFGDRLRQSRVGRRVGPERWGRADAHLAEHGGRAVFFGRFIGILRALVPALAGASRMPYRKFVFWNALGGLLWAPGLVLLGYVAGGSYRRVEHYAGRAGLLLAVVVLAVGSIVAAARWTARHPERVRSWFERHWQRPAVRRLYGRYRRPLDFIAHRAQPGRALGLSLTLHLAALAAVGWAFGTLVRDVIGRAGVVRVDGPVTTYVVAHRTAWLTTMMRATTLVGSTVVLVPVIVAVGVWSWRRGRGWMPLATLATAQLGAIALYDLVKALVGRPRPTVGPLVATATGFAFPSGHATQAVAVIGALAFLSTSRASLGMKAATWAGAAIVVLLVGFSRVYLGVHWTSDVIGGYALGALWLAAMLTTLRTVGDLRGRPGERGAATPGRGKG